MTFKEICETYGMRQVDMSYRFNIPIRTVQDWYSGRRNPPPYVIGMIVEILEAQVTK